MDRQTDGQMDGRTPDRYPNPSPHTMRAWPIFTDFDIAICRVVITLRPPNAIFYRQRPDISGCCLVNVDHYSYNYRHPFLYKISNN